MSYQRGPRWQDEDLGSAEMINPLREGESDQLPAVVEAYLRNDSGLDRGLVQSLINRALQNELYGIRDDRVLLEEFEDLEPVTKATIGVVEGAGSVLDHRVAEVAGVLGNLRLVATSSRDWDALDALSFVGRTTSSSRELYQDVMGHDHRFIAAETWEALGAASPKGVPQEVWLESDLAKGSLSVEDLVKENTEAVMRYQETRSKSWAEAAGYAAKTTRPSDSLTRVDFSRAPSQAPFSDTLPKELREVIKGLALGGYTPEQTRDALAAAQAEQEALLSPTPEVTEEATPQPSPEPTIAPVEATPEVAEPEDRSSSRAQGSSPARTTTTYTPGLG